MTVELNHLMLDIEAMGKAPSGAIFQIGICGFNESEIVYTGVININLSSSVAAGMSIDPSTVEFWMDNAGTYRTIRDYCDGEDIYSALRRLESMIKDWSKIEGVWSNAPTYDFTILRYAYKLYGLTAPWSHRQERCSRTLLYLVGKVFEDVYIPERQPEQTKHMADCDAAYQAQVTIALMQQLGAA